MFVRVLYSLPSRELTITYPTKGEVWKIIILKSAFVGRGYVSFQEGIQFIFLRLFQHTELEHTPKPLPTGYKQESGQHFLRGKLAVELQGCPPPKINIEP